MDRGYQHSYSEIMPSMFDKEGRQRKAKTMITVLSEHVHTPLSELSALNIGGSAGIIDEYLSRYFGQMVGVDIDEKAIAYARQRFQKEGLTFEVGDAMDLRYGPDLFDVVICSQVYEHVPDARVLLAEIFRVLKPGGAVYFAAGNRLMVQEPHYKLPFLSVLPRPVAHRYLRLTGRGEYYYEKHFTYWGLQRLVSHYDVTDYTPLILADPVKYGAEYMVTPGSWTQKIAECLSRYMIWVVPGYIWVLEKPDLEKPEIA
ncbi:MAG: class I SAM-dependent methyltransferase [Halioglobus sp.]|nr:class I SAM-dependent methyltransferase [Halioglobus sp.]